MGGGRKLERKRCEVEDLPSFEARHLGFVRTHMNAIKVIEKLDMELIYQGLN
jgi:hypothetical protein